MKINYKWFSVSFCACLAIASVIFFIMTFSFKQAPGTIFATGPQFYPMLLCGLFFVLAVISIIHTLRAKEVKYIDIPFPKNYVFILAVVILWTVLWQILDAFYPVSFLGVGAMLYVLNPDKSSWKKLFKTLCIDLIIVIFVYVVFSILLKMNL